MTPAAPVWHEKPISEAMRATLRDLCGRGLLANFYLARGTALALHLGHRRSVDLDFLNLRAFNPDEIIQSLLGLEELQIIATGPGTLHASMRGVKVSFLHYRYPLLFPLAEYRGVAVADAREIACMKISAIASRGARRDFIDLYAARRLGGLEVMLDWFAQKYADAHYSRTHLLKSLVYFHDAEQEPMPDMLLACDWAALKIYFSQAAQLL